MKHVVNYSGGIGSWATAKRVAAEHGTDDMVLLFADTKMEDEDLYRFNKDVEKNLGIPITVQADGRDVWEVFFDERFLGNSRVDPCSKMLKRELLKKYIDQNFDPSDTTVYIGIDWSESHRAEKYAHFWHPYNVETPLCNPPYLTKDDMIAWAVSEGINPPRLYEMGFKHNNCGGFCIKAGQGQFKLLLQKMPERYKYHEEKEQELREYLGKDVTILRKMTKGKRSKITLKEFRENIEQQLPIDELEWGGCSCFMPDD